MSERSLLFIGRDSGTARHRAMAFRRLGYHVAVIDPLSFYARNRFIDTWTWQTGGLFLGNMIRKQVLSSIPNVKFDCVHVDGGELVGPDLVRELKDRFGTVFNYNIDDPFGPRDGRRWKRYLEALPFYDLVVVLRDCNVPEAIANGARDVLRVTMSADEVAHAPTDISESDASQFGSEVAFVGTWMPERGPFLARLIDLGVPLSIYGDRWHKAPEWAKLKPRWRGPGIYSDQQYAKVLQTAKVNLGLLSKGNRDLTTTRSFEIPHLRGVLCAERTSEHLRLYDEGGEAVFWSSPEECADKCMELLADHSARKNLGIRGRKRCIANGTTNETILTNILSRAMHSQPSLVMQ